MRLLQAAWSWLSEMVPPPVAAAVYALTGTATRLKRRNPFQTGREAIARTLAGASCRVAVWTIHGDDGKPVPPTGPRTRHELHRQDTKRELQEEQQDARVFGRCYGVAPASNLLIGFPWTSVRRKSRPWKRKVSFVCARPSRRRIVAWMSWTWQGSSTGAKPSSSVSPRTMPGRVPPPANHMAPHSM